MASQAPLSVAEAEASIVALRERLADTAAVDATAASPALRDLHQILMRATPGCPDPPLSLLDTARSAVSNVGTDVTDKMSPRPRTVFRLLRAGSLPAAWAVATENATGAVDDRFDESTATGAARTSWRLPLLTRIEAGTVYAELPGFRDPRYATDDDSYDITDTVNLRTHIDQVEVSGAKVCIGGWAALDVLTADPTESVSLVATNAATEIRGIGRRLRRADLVSGRGEALTRRAWAGWSACLDVTDPRLGSGDWALSVEVEHDGLRRRAPLGRDASDLARTLAVGAVEVRRRNVKWDTSRTQWRLQVTDVA